MGIGNEIGLRLAPTTRIDLVRASRDGFTETGAGILNMTVAGNSVSRSWLGAGVAVSTRFAGESGAVFMPSLKLFYEHLADGRSTATASAIPLASANFVTPGVLEDAGYLSVEAGLDVEFSENVSLHIDYAGAFSGNSDSQRGTLGFRVNF